MLGSRKAAPAASASVEVDSKLEASIQAFYSGQAALLSHGRVQYKLQNEGSFRKPLVVCIHGINTGLYQWAQLAQDLSLSGRSVLTYDLYGRGGSDDPKAEHTLPLFVSQLAELLQYIRHHHFQGEAAVQCEKVVVVGMSMGGAVAAAFAETFPWMVDRVILCAPTGLPAPLPLIGKLVKLPLLGEAAGSLLKRQPHRLAEVAAQAYADPENPVSKKLIERTALFIRDQCEHKEGYMKGLLSTLRSFPFTKMEPIYAALGAKPTIPFLLVWGDLDKVSPYMNASRLLELIPHAKLVTLAGGAHADNFGSMYPIMRGAISDFLAA